MSITRHNKKSFFRLKLNQTVGAVLTGFLVVGILMPIIPARAMSYGFSAKEMIRSDQTLIMTPGEIKDFSIGFKNTGTKTWSNTGPNFVSVYTYAPKYRKSVFSDSAWFRPDQPTLASYLSVPAGQLGMFKIRLKAPTTPGTYTETFHLAAENLAWIPGGEFSIRIQVNSQAVAVQPTPAPTTSVSTTTPIITSASVARADYKTQEIARSESVVKMQPGEVKQFSIDFKNNSPVTWLPDGKRFISIYTYNPKYRSSVFSDSSWYQPDQPARLSNPSVNPGEVGTIRFNLRAPATAGTYTETFHLAAEDFAWVSGGQFTVHIEVASTGSSNNNSAPAPTTPTIINNDSDIPLVSTADGYSALKMLTSDQQVKLSAGELYKFRVAFKNNGILPWVKYGNEPVALKVGSGIAENFRDNSWQENLVSIIQQDRAEPGHLAFFEVNLRAPNTSGLFNARFALHAGDRVIEGGAVEIPVQVTGGSVSATVPLATSNQFANSGPKGPNIRVGLYYDTKPVTVVGTGSYQIIDGRDHLPVRQVSGVTTVTFNFSTLQYTVSNNGWTYTTDYHVHLRPNDMDNHIFEILSYENRAAWDSSVNYNKFRGDLSVHYMRSTGRLWVIEELPVEDYIRGLAETSNGSPREYQRALVAAARNYALFVISIGGKHKSEYHDVNTTAGDQVYKGYASELIRPNVVAAVEATRGTGITYNGELVVTPYFSRSDGRTRSWSEVWGGTRAWCISVPTPYDQGKTLWGHGVGMSASDALGRANAGASWTEILRYYYTGIDIVQLY